MYLVKTYLDRSGIHGVGVFADEDIPKGTVVWEFLEGVDHTITQEEFESFSDRAKAFLKTYAFWDKGLIYKCGDHGSYTNHSETPNTGNWPNTDSLTEVALRDIKKGEEITSDYRTFDELSRHNLSAIIGA